MYVSKDFGNKPSDDPSSNEVIRIRNWSINFQQSVLDTTALGDTDRTIFHGVRSFSGSGTLLFYEVGTTRETNVGHLARRFIYQKGETSRDEYNDPDFGQLSASKRPQLVLMELGLGESSNDERESIEFYAYITSLGVACSTGEIVTSDFSFEGHGAPIRFDL